MVKPDVPEGPPEPVFKGTPEHFERKVIQCDGDYQLLILHNAEFNKIKRAPTYKEKGFSK